MRFPTLNILLVFILFFKLLGAQIPIPTKPSVLYPINDYASVLTEDEKNRLNTKLIQYADSTSTQIVVALVNTINQDEINLFAAKWAESWKIGEAKKNNGVFILLAVQDRKMTIQTGRGVEAVLTDYQTQYIIKKIFVPNLKQNNYYNAINQGSDSIISILNGEFKNNKSTDEISLVQLLPFIVLILVLIWILTKNNNNSGGGRGYRRDGLDDIILYGSGRSLFGGGSFGGSSGGGFGGFSGGGSFGGGGSSGSW